MQNYELKTMMLNLVASFSILNFHFSIIIYKNPLLRIEKRGVAGKKSIKTTLGLVYE
jgi:hypothetical protein